MDYMFCDARAFNGDRGVSWPSRWATPRAKKERPDHCAKVAVVWDVDCLIEGRETLFRFLKSVQHLSGEAHRQTTAKKNTDSAFQTRLRRAPSGK
eukprot:2885861-Amphidinium_carterae.1